MSSQTLFQCSNCGAQFQKWTGRCLECGKWGTVEKEAQVQTPTKSKTGSQPYAPAKTQRLSDIEGSNMTRVDTHIQELNRVLGGGIVPGSMILLGGEPGIGKSTLALQLAAIVPNTLYLSGEESVQQIKLRADRLASVNQDPASSAGKYPLSVSIANETNIETILATIKKETPPLVIIDSIQTMWSADVEGEPGNPTQIRACTVKILDIAKSTNTAVMLIGHVTKEGVVAGPRMLEHLVDTVLYLEGERYHAYRILRTVKNRFGPTDEVGIFEMVEHGLVEVKNPSAAFLAERGDIMPGSIITCLLEGTRPMLVEVQALVNKTVFGFPVRKASGFDLNRLHVLVAVLQKRAGLNLSQYDIHVNIVGGLKAKEPSADLAVCLAIASAFKDKALDAATVAFGEVGLGGEIRSVAMAEKRIKESAALGMKRIITSSRHTTAPKDVTLLGVKHIDELVKKT